MLSGIIFILIHISISKSPRFYSSQEQDVQFLESSVLRLWQSEISPNCGNQTQSSPEESSLAFPVPLGWVYHIWFQNTADDIPKIIRATAQNNCLGSKSGGANLSNDSVHDWPNRHGVCSKPNEAECCLHILDSIGLWDTSQDGDEVQCCYQDAKSNKEDGPSSKFVYKEPGNNGPTEGNSSTTKTDSISGISVNAGLLKEIRWRVC